MTRPRCTVCDDRGCEFCPAVRLTLIPGKDTSLRPRPGESAEDTLDRVVTAIRKEQA